MHVHKQNHLKSCSEKDTSCVNVNNKSGFFLPFILIVVNFVNV